jgi:hypothetical protein
LVSILGFELRALPLLGKRSSVSAMPPFLFGLGYFSDRISSFLLRPLIV